MTVTVIVPVLDRPHRVHDVLRSIRESQRDVPLETLFVASPNDRRELQALREAKAPFVTVPWEPGTGDYARKINHACRETESEWVFAGADDLSFRFGWADNALRAHRETGKRFVSTNDMGNPLVRKGRHATHPLVHRSYLPLAVVDSPGDLYHEGYHHEACDIEATETAMARGEFVFARQAIVEHLHPIWKKAPLDATYERGRSKGREDRALCFARKPLWQHLTA